MIPWTRVPDENPLRATARRFRPLLVVGSILGGVGWSLVWLEKKVTEPLGACDAHLDLQLAGVAEHGACDHITLAALHESLRLDETYALRYAAIIGVISICIRPAPHLDRRLALGSYIARFSVFGAAFIDVVENKLMYASAVETPNGLAVSGEWCRAVLASVASVKWVLLLVAIVNLVVLLDSLFAERPFEVSDQPARHRVRDWWHRNQFRFIWGPNSEPDFESDDQPADVPDAKKQRLDGIDVCCSGGGIRSAGFSLGALWELERQEVLSRVRSIAAVSGGNYTATAWSVERVRALQGGGSGQTACDTLINRLLNTERAGAFQVGALLSDSEDPDAILRVGTEGSDGVERIRSHKGRHRYLSAGPGGLPRSLVMGFGAFMANAVQILAIIVLVGRGLATVLQLSAVRPFFALELLDARPFQIEDHHWRPGLLLVGAGVGLAACGALFRRWPVRAFAMSLAPVTFVVGLISMLIGTAVPWLMVQFTNLGTGRDAFAVGSVSVGAVVLSLFRLAANPLRRQAPRLGGVALAALAALLVGKVAVDVITGIGPFASNEVFYVAVVVFVTSALLADTQAASLRELYRTRLADAFIGPDLRCWLVRRDSPSWADLRNLGPEIPELIVCCSASRVGLTPAGIPAESFTISQHCVRHHRSSRSITIPTQEYTERLRSLALRPLDRPAGWLATSGAAFASSMGQKSLGTTNALLAAVNADLGVWLPAPRLVKSDGSGPRYFPPVRLGHLFNEMFGVYAANDEQIFVADGGHIENLGLIELLRQGERKGWSGKRPQVIVSLDASGDQLGSFSTLRSALDVADTVLTERLWFDKRELDESSLPANSSVYRIPFCAWDDRPAPGWSIRPSIRVGVIYYAKLQPARDQSPQVRKFAKIDPRFPRYSTANQLLDDQQFAFLVFAGRDAARTLVQHLAADGHLPSP